MSRLTWQALSELAPRAAFVPDRIWISDPDGPGYFAVSRESEPDRWAAEVAANEPVVTQIDLGGPPDADGSSFATSSSSMPSVVADMLTALDLRPGMRVLEIGTGTGWNAALLAALTGPAGQVTSIEVDAGIARAARHSLAGYPVKVVTGDGEHGHPANAPYDRIIATAAVRERVPAAWLSQLRPGGRLITPWSTDYGTGMLLTLTTHEDGTAVGEFSGNLAFMRLRGHLRSRFGWVPDAATIATARESTTDIRGDDMEMMFSPHEGLFAIGIRLPNASLILRWNKCGENCHLIDLDDLDTNSFARVHADLNNPAPFRVQQLGRRRLWDEAIAAYDWWYANGRPGADRLGLSITATTQTAWLDSSDNPIRTWPR